MNEVIADCRLLIVDWQRYLARKDLAMQIRQSAIGNQKSEMILWKH